MRVQNEVPLMLLLDVKSIRYFVKELPLERQFLPSTSGHCSSLSFCFGCQIIMIMRQKLSKKRQQKVHKQRGVQTGKERSEKKKEEKPVEAEFFLIRWSFHANSLLLFIHLFNFLFRSILRMFNCSFRLPHHPQELFFCCFSSSNIFNSKERRRWSCFFLNFVQLPLLHCCFGITFERWTSSTKWTSFKRKSAKVVELKKEF